jgi:excisionase family DNA binding protein
MVSTEKLLLTVKDACGLLSVSRSTLDLLTRRGELPVVRLRRGVRYNTRDVLAVQ